MKPVFLNAKFLKVYLPIIILVFLALMLALGLRHDPRELPSVKIGKPAPSFTLNILPKEAGSEAPEVKFSSADMRGKVWILNVFASWCAACVDEMPVLARFAQQHDTPLIGLAYKDAPVDTQQWLQRFGNPYQQIATDLDGNVGIDFGVYGVPETYIIDAEGVIRYRHVGAVGDDFYEKHVAPIINSKTLSPTQPANHDVTAETPSSKVNLSDAEVEARMKNLAAELRCLVCQNQTILDSNAALAVDLKRQITEQIRAGRSDEAIKNYMLERYGEFILYNPPLNLKNIFLWTLPFVVMLIGFVIAIRAHRRVATEPTEAQSGAKHKASKKKATDKLADVEALYQNTRE